jgi:hypothetical protein
MIDPGPNPKKRARKIRERDVEAYLVKRVEGFGGTCEKFSSPAKRSVPDRLVCWPEPSVCFVECKAPGEVPTPPQARDHERRRKMGFRVYVVDTKGAVDEFIQKEVSSL